MRKKRDDSFFSALAAELGMIDMSFARQACYAYSRVVVRMLKEGKRVVIPDFGIFRVTTMKARIRPTINSRAYKLLPSIKTMRFKPDWKIKGALNPK